MSCLATWCNFNSISNRVYYVYSVNNIGSVAAYSDLHPNVCLTIRCSCLDAHSNSEFDIPSYSFFSIFLIFPLPLPASFKTSGFTQIQMFTHCLRAGGWRGWAWSPLTPWSTRTSSVPHSDQEASQRRQETAPRRSHPAETDLQSFRLLQDYSILTKNLSLKCKKLQFFTFLFWFIYLKLIVNIKLY